MSGKPRKITYEPLKKAGWEYECPYCGKAVGFNKFGMEFTDEDNYCPSCGGKLNWSKVT